MTTRIPIQNIYYLLCYAWDMADMRQRVKVEAEASHSMPNLLVHILAQVTEHLLKRGLSQDYRTRISEVEGIKGKLDIGETLKTNSLRQGRTFCGIDELSSNTTLNQILFSTLMEVKWMESVDAINKQKVERLLRRFPVISIIRITHDTFRHIRISRNNRHYQMAMHLCQLLQQSLSPQQGLKGVYEFLDFKDDEERMNILFERFLMNFYKQECKQEFPEVSRSRIRFQLTPYGMTFAKSTDEAYRLLPVMETDVTLYNPHTKKRIILDAKYYKQTLVSRYGENGKIRREHLSQILSYVMNQEDEAAPQTKETKGILVYPTVDADVDVSYVYKNTRHVIRVCTVNLNQDWWQIEQRLKEIIKEREIT